MKGLFLIEHKKATGPSIWARTVGSHLEQKGIVKQIETYKWPEFFKTALSLYKYDFIHFYSQTFQGGVLSFLALLMGKKQVFTVHGNINAELNTKQGTFWYPFKQIFWMPINHYIFAVCKGITYPSTFNQNSNKVWHRKHHIMEVIPNPITIDDHPAKQPFSGGQLNLAIVTNFKFPEKERGIDFLVLVLDELKNKGLTAVLNVIGDGPHLESFQERYRDRKDIIFHGHKIPYERDVILQKCHIFTYASFLDNMPYVILEAINLRLPVISNNVGAVTDMIPESYVVTDESPKTYAQKLESLITPQNYINAQTEQYSKLQSMFSIEHVGEMFINFYKRVIAG